MIDLPDLDSQLAALPTSCLSRMRPASCPTFSNFAGAAGPPKPDFHLPNHPIRPPRPQPSAVFSFLEKSHAYLCRRNP